MAVKGEGPKSNNIIPGLRAGADLRLKQYHAVKYGTDEYTVVACGAGERPVGILQNTPNTGEAASVHLLDGSTVGALAVDTSTITAGVSMLKVDGDGKGTVTTTDNDIVFAISHETVAGTAREIVAHFIPPTRY